MIFFVRKKVFVLTSLSKGTKLEILNDFPQFFHPQLLAFQRSCLQLNL